MKSIQTAFIPFFFFSLLSIAACSSNNLPPESQKDKPAPDFTLKDIKSREFSLKKAAGQLVLLRFWSTQCKSCREEMPKLEKTYQDLLPSGMTLIAINIGDSPEKIKTFIEGLGLTFPILLDESKNIAKEYEVFGVPTSFIIDKKGYIRERFFGDLDERELKELIKPYLMNPV